MFSSDYKWQHDYVRLVSDTGFSFERHKTDNFDKNKISSVDIDHIIQERDFATIDKLIPSITRFVLDPEQARILDSSFVKTFLLSQLAIQYLLYCKKYLDNSLIIVKGELKKIKQDNAELNLFVNDLKAHVSSLVKQIDEKPVFNCTQCNKIFSSEEFLNSHIKRRHNVPTEIETNKLQMEIKELKGRLNNAEKMIQKEQSDVDPNSKDTEFKKIEDLQQKFEDLRLQVQSELKVLQTQHNFQEKYEKLFEKVALQSGKFSGGGDFGLRRESTTQTDVEGALATVLEAQNKENIPDVSNTQKQMTEFGEALETKVASSLKKIENQMESFWSKLNEMDRYRKNDDFPESESEKPKPVIRSRTKYSIKNLDPEREQASKISPVHFVKKKEPVETELLTKESKQPVRVVNVQLKKTVDSDETEESSVKNVKEQQSNKILQHSPTSTDIKKHFKISTDEIDSEIITDPDETTTSETLASESAVTADSSEKAVQPVKPRKPQPIPRKRPHPKTLDKPEFDNVLQEFTVEVEKIIMERLQDLGVSPEWTGLPTRSFQRAMEIVNHQASLMKKTYPNFNILLAQIEKQVCEKVELKNHKKTKVIKETKKRASNKRKVQSPKIEIKNRSMYDTESDSEIKPIQVKETFQQFSVPYSAVIEELKAVTSKIESDKEVKGPVKTEETKGVLKSYPSVGSLTKKKVLFNLDTDEKKDLNKEGGSTTSVASSVLDGTPRKEEKKKDKEKDIEDLSDFDFSDM